MSAPNQAPTLKVPTPGNRPKPRLMIPSGAAGKSISVSSGGIGVHDPSGASSNSSGLGGGSGASGAVSGGYDTGADRITDDLDSNSLGQQSSSASQYQSAVPAPLAIGVPSSGPSPAPRRTSGARPAPPKLQLATPKTNNNVKPTPTPLQVGTTPATAQQQQQQQQQQSSIPGGPGNFSSAPHSRSGSYTQSAGSANNPASASASASSYSALSLAMGMKPSHQHGTNEAPGMSSVYEDGAEQLTRDLDKMSLELGRPVDADDLDDEGWLAARTTGRIIEIDVLGEGAGGAVTKCQLKDGKTVFALKVCLNVPL